jgi:hypothetical protein
MNKNIPSPDDFILTVNKPAFLSCAIPFSIVICAITLKSSFFLSITHIICLCSILIRFNIIRKDTHFPAIVLLFQIVLFSSLLLSLTLP